MSVKNIDQARIRFDDSLLSGHGFMALERFSLDTKHLIVFDVLNWDSPVGFKGERMRLFLSDEGYDRAVASQGRNEIKILKHAKVFGGNLFA